MENCIAIDKLAERDGCKEYRIVGLTVFIISIALLVMRILNFYLQVATIGNSMDRAWYYLLIDASFSIPVQLGILLLFPFLMYKFALGKSFKDVLAFSGYRKCGIGTVLLSFAAGFFIIFITMFVSAIWLFLITLFGYDLPSGGDELPASFNAAYLIISVLLTAVLPCICEEFTNRGGLLTALRSRYSEARTIVLVGIAFGLFHQNITQTVYTALLGALFAFLVLKTGSVYPAMIMHFMNNFMSILIDNGTNYGWPVLGGIYDFVQNTSLNVVVSALALVVLVEFCLIFLIVRSSSKSRQKEFYLQLNAAAAKERPTLKDNIFFIGAIVVTVVSTVMTFILGI